jgi:hypothetical protein
MATPVYFHCFSENLAEGVHNLGSNQLVVALLAAANAPSASSNTVLANLTQASYTNCSTRNVTTTSSAQTSGAYKLVLADLVLTASGGTVGPFRYVVLYNDTPTSPADPLIYYLDCTSDITLQSGETFTIDFDGAAGAITL